MWWGKRAAEKVYLTVTFFDFTTGGIYG